MNTLRVIALLAAVSAILPAEWEHRRPGGAYASRRGGIVHVGNQFLDRVYRISDETARTIALINKLSGSEPSYLEGSEFVLLLSGAVSGEVSALDFALKDVQVINQASKPLLVKFLLIHRNKPALAAVITVETEDQRKYQRRWLDIHWTGEADVVVERADVEVHRLGWWHNGKPWHSGFGQPLFVRDLYLGLEFPGAETSDSFLRQYPGVSVKGGWRSKPAIWGVAKDQNSVRNAFSDYLASMDSHRRTPFVIYNLLGTGNPDERKMLTWIPRIAQSAKEAGFQIDSFAMDDRWQDDSSVWQAAAVQFPRGLEPVTQAAQLAGARLGLWLSPHGFTLNTRWGARRGLETVKIGDRSDGGQYCIAGARYRAELKRTLGEYIQRHGVNYFKFDYNRFQCDNPAHGHPIGRASKDALIDALLDVLQFVRRTGPDVHIAMTSGMWLSPWWAPYADWVWLGGSDLGQVEKVPALTPHDSAITYRDAILYEDFREKSYAFPFDAVMTHGFWVEKGAPFARFKDDVVLTLGRGVTKWEILTSPDLLTPDHYRFLGKAMRWGKANWETLKHTRMILGNPTKGEVYGYAHTDAGRALVFLRNPSLTTTAVDVDLANAGVLTARQDWRAREVYPVAQPAARTGPRKLWVEVAGGQTKVISIVWDSHELPGSLE